MTSSNPEGSARNGWWDVVAAVFSFLFAVAMIANTHPDGDGLWFWYASSILGGQKLYTALHLNLQPLFVLCTAAFLRILGPGWMAFKVFPTLQALLYCLGLLLVVRSIPMRAWERGLLLLAVFGLTITTSFYRFDDYHVTTQILQIGVLLLLLRLPRVGERNALWMCAGLGLLCGISLSNRLNDGAALFLACFSAIPFLLRTKRLVALLLLSVTTVAGLLSVVLMTGDTIAAWHLQSITLASRIKGGTGSILLTPLALPWRLLRTSLGPGNLLIFGGVAFLIFLVSRYTPAVSDSKPQRKSNVLLIAAVVLACLAWIVAGMRGKTNPTLGLAICLGLLAAGVWVYGCMLRDFRGRHCQREALLVLVPFWGLIGASLTSGSLLPDFEPNAAVFLLISPLVVRSLLEVRWMRRGLLLVCFLLTIAFIPAKTLVPYQWHHYHADPLFVNRTVYQHPDFGPMIVEKPQLKFMEAMCATIHASGGSPSLLALPYPYPNYFCDIAPWHGYVQTWYDTSGKATIDGLEGELATAPPNWIAYQRSLDTLTLNENAIFPKPVLPQRELDREIMGKVEADQWTIASRSCFEGSDWLLIRTTPPAVGEHHGVVSDADDKFQACKPTETDFWTLHKFHKNAK